MGDLLKKKFIYVASFVIMAIVIEFLGFNFMGLGIFPKYFWMDIFVIVLIASVIFVIPSFVAEAVAILLVLLLQALITAVNHSLYVFQGKTIFGFEMLYYAGAAGEAFEVEFISIPFIIAMVACVLIEAIFLFLLRKYKVKHDFKTSTVFGVILIFSFSAFVSTMGYGISVSKLQTVSDTDITYRLKDEKYLYTNCIQKEKAMKKFGTYVFYFRQIANMLNNNMNKNKYLAQVDAYLGEDEKYIAKKTDYTGVAEGNNVITIMVETGENYIIDEKLTPNLYALKQNGCFVENYHSKDKTNHSEALAMLGSYPLECNVLENLRQSAESDLDIYPFSLPSVLKRNGYNTQYFHSNNGEFYQRADSMKGYGFENAYFREDMNLRDGVKNGFYDLDLDSKLFETNLERICDVTDGKPFYSFITTLIMHGDYEDLVENGDYAEYERDGTPISEAERAKRNSKYAVKTLGEYYLKINDFSDTLKNEYGITFESLTERYGEEEALEWYYRYKRFQAGAMDLDKGIGYLLEYLDNNNLLDTTTILVYGDHNAYYNDQQYVFKMHENADGTFTPIKPGETWYTELYNVFYTLYDGSADITYVKPNGEVKTHKSSKKAVLPKNNNGRFACTLDTVPTLLDLLGFSYDTRLYHGTSLFSDEDVPTTAFISRENGYLTDGVYTIYDDLFYVDGKPYVYSGDNVYVCANTETLAKGALADGDTERKVVAFNESIVKYLEKQEKLELLYMTKYFAKADKFDNANIDLYIRKA